MLLIPAFQVENLNDDSSSSHCIRYLTIYIVTATKCTQKLIMASVILPTTRFKCFSYCGRSFSGLLQMNRAFRHSQFLHTCFVKLLQRHFEPVLLLVALYFKSATHFPRPRVLKCQARFIPLLFFPYLKANSDDHLTLNIFRVCTTSLGSSSCDISVGVSLPQLQQ